MFEYFHIWLSFLMVGTISKIAQTDNDSHYVATGRNGKLNTFYVPNLQYTTVGKLIIYRLMEDRDVKIIITGKGKTTGTGKTTLAILFARFVNLVRNDLFGMDTEWTSREYSFMDVWDYLKQYEEANPGDPLITDELEYMADRRRAMSDTNLFFSQAWSVLRYKNAVTIGTAPGLMDLEKRIPEGADIWLNVVFKGKANSYYITAEDFPPYQIIFRRMRQGGMKESILWNPIESDDDYQYLKNTKQELGVPGLGKKEETTIDESDMNQMERDIRNEYVRETLRFLADKELIERFTQTEIADMAKVSQPQVSKIKKEMEKEGTI